MPPRFAYWTIILDGKPTAFRTQYRDELLPTFKQLQAKHPSATMMWFARGKLWSSPEEAQAAARKPTGVRRAPDWRPGGQHVDPRARFKIPRDEKRRRFAANLRRDTTRTEGGKSGTPSDTRGTRPPSRFGAKPRPWQDKERRAGPDRPRTGQPRERSGKPQRPRSGSDRSKAVGGGFTGRPRRAERDGTRKPGGGRGRGGGGGGGSR